jgi:hypothetical protein
LRSKSCAYCISARTAQDVPVCWEESPEPADLLAVALTAKTAFGSVYSAPGAAGSEGFVALRYRSTLTPGRAIHVDAIAVADLALLCRADWLIRGGGCV